MLEARLPVLGLETTFRTDSPEVLDAVRTSYGHWSALPPEVVDASDVVVSLASDDSVQRRPDAAAVHRLAHPVSKQNYAVTSLEFHPAPVELGITHETRESRAAFTQARTCG